MRSATRIVRWRGNGGIDSSVEKRRRRGNWSRNVKRNTKTKVGGRYSLFPETLVIIQGLAQTSQQAFSADPARVPTPNIEIRNPTRRSTESSHSPSNSHFAS